MKFLKMLEELVGKRSQRSTMDVWTENKQPRIGELRGLAKLTRAMTRDPVELEEPGKKLKTLMHSDIDPNTGKAYKDYKERRRKRREANKEPSCAGTYDNWKLDE
jgi:hypothetical protein